MGDNVESIYDFEVVDEWSESEDPANEAKRPGYSDDLTNLKEDNKDIKKPTEGEIDAFLENVKELVTSETSGLKAGSKSLNITKQNSINPNTKILNPTVNITNNLNSSNNTRKINLSRTKLNCYSTSDSRVKINTSTVSYKPGGTPVKTFFPEPTHSINDDSSPFLANQELSITSSPYSFPHSLKQIEDSEDDFSDYRGNVGSNSPSYILAKRKSLVENESKHRHRRSLEPSRYKENKSSERSSPSKFSRERYNSRKEIFNERSNRDKRRLEDRRSRGRSRSRSRERRRHRKARSKPRRSYLSLSPTPPTSRRIEAEEHQRGNPHYNPTAMPNNVPPYYPAPQGANSPFTPLPSQSNVALENSYYMNSGNFQAPSGAGHNLSYPMNQEAHSKYPNYGGPMAPTQSYGYPAQGYSQQGYQGYVPSQTMTEPNSYPWVRPPPPYSAAPSNPISYYQIKGDNKGGESSKNAPHWNRSASRDRREMNEMLGKHLDSESPPHRKYSRSSTPDSRKSHKRKSKKHSRSPDSYKSRSSRRHKNKHKSPDPDAHETKKKPKVLIDPDRIPTPPPPPILSSIDNKPRRTSEKINKTFQRPLSEILDKETVSLSCLLEAVMETSGQGKSQLSDPKVKTEILSQCETKIRQLYKRRIAGKGAFIPDPVEARQINSRGSPLITFHPRLSYNEGPEKRIWKCPGIKVPPVKKLDPSDMIISKPAPICTLVSNRQPSPAPVSYMAQAVGLPGLMNVPILPPGVTYEPSDFQDVSNSSAWPGYGIPNASYSDPSYNAWTGSYNSDGLWQGDNQQTAPTYQYNVQAPAEEPSKSENISFPTDDKTENPSRTERSPSLEPPPFTYRREPQRDLLLLAGKKSKRKKKKPPKANSPPKSNSSEVSSSMNVAPTSNYPMNMPMNIVPSSYMPMNVVPSSYMPLNMPMNVVPSNDSSLNMAMNIAPSSNYSFENVESNPFQHFESDKKKDVSCTNNTASKTDDKNLDNKNLSSSIKEMSRNPLKESKERLERKYCNLRKTNDTPQYESYNMRDDGGYNNKEMSTLRRPQNITNEDEVITIEDTDIQESSLLKFNDNLNRPCTQSTQINSIGSQPELNKTQEDISPSDKQNRERDKYSSRSKSKTYDKNDDRNLHVGDVRKNNCGESSVIEITSDIEDKEKNSKDEDLNFEAIGTENKLTINHYYDIGTEIRKIQEKSISYKSIIESLQKGDLGYRRLYEFKNKALCKIDSRLKKLKIVIPRDYLKDLIVILHKKFHDVNQDEMFKSIKECTYPEILHVNKCILKVFSECPDCKLEPLRVEPLIRKTTEKKQNNKTEKKFDTRTDKIPTDSKKTDGNSKRRDSYSYSSTSSSRYKGKRINEDRGQVDSSDGRPTGYEKATRSKVLTPKQDKNQENQCLEGNNLSDKSKFRGSVGLNIPDTSDGHTLENNESETQVEIFKVDSPNNKESFEGNDKLMERKDENKTGIMISMKNDTGFDFKSRVRNVQMKVYSEIFHDLESGEKAHETDETYLLKGGMLCKKSLVENGCEVKIVAPPSAIEEVIHIVHTMSSTHTPSPKVIAFFSKHFTSVDDLDDKVNKFVSNCTQCK